MWEFSSDFSENHKEKMACFSSQNGAGFQEATETTHEK